MNIYVIAGHGAGDPGACANGYQEAERVRALAARIKELGGASVTLHDVNDNAYASGALNRLSVPGGTGVVELHMDSAGAGARGAHVIIKSGLKADAVDQALAQKLSAILPGRAQTIVGRSNLANPNRAAARGINYRLCENGFISDAGDVSTFNSRLDDLARAYLEAFGIDAQAPSGAPVEPPAGDSGELAVDGYWGPETSKRAQELCGTPADGVVSSQDAAWRSRVPACQAGWEWVSKAGGSQLMLALQEKWGVKADGLIGPDTINAMIRYYMARGSGATVCDGRLDAASPTVKAFQRELNAGRI